ncbi:hypothetical protein ABW21_db0206735 [Orbilia brochopaga]|nr:hypothetical protein ABW21_db0206735 [Drechslerella brochopaga]
MAGTATNPIFIDEAPAHPHDATAQEHHNPADPQDDNEDGIQIFNGVRYRPRYHQNPDRPAATLLDFFYERVPDDFESDGRDKDDENEEVDTNFRHITLGYVSDEGEDEDEDEDDAHSDDLDPAGMLPLSTPARGRKLKMTFKRAESLDRSIASLPAQENRGPRDYQERVRSLSLEAKLPEVDVLVANLIQRLDDCLKLNKDLEAGNVAYSKWSVEIVCADGEVLDMLMAYRRMDRWRLNKSRGVGGPMLSYFVPPFRQSKKT